MQNGIKADYDGRADVKHVADTPLQYTKQPFKEVIAPRKIKSIRFGLQSSQEVVRALQPSPFDHPQQGWYCAALAGREASLKGGLTHPD
jgi:hypothetical protein